MKVLGISGSLRADAYNTKLLRAALEHLPGDVEVELCEWLRDVPPYDEDDDVEPAPPAVAALRAALAHRPFRALSFAFPPPDAVLIATPEYNSSVPGQLKNALDWASRPLRTNPLRNKPVVVVGASTGAFGAVWAQEELRKVLRAIGARVVEDGVAVRHAAQQFDEDGHVVHDAVDRQLEQVVRALVGLVREREHALAAA
jgi:chromate reductase, NAD(P)H dehydrogenase (quinone)